MRRALTLVELLVVISIMVLLFAVAVPRFLGNTDERRVREGARMVASFIHDARAVGAGVQIKSDRVQRVVLPPLYTGTDDSSAFLLQAVGPGKIIAQSTPSAIGVPLEIGNTIQFGLRGWMSASVTYNIDDVSVAGDVVTLKASTLPSQQIPWPVGSWSYPQVFAIKLSPVPTIAAVRPLFLPQRTIIETDIDTLFLKPRVDTAYILVRHEDWASDDGRNWWVSVNRHGTVTSTQGTKQ